MKCPYRPTTITTDNSTTTEFAECYGRECPWYMCAKTTDTNKIVSDDCQRCHTENTQASGNNRGRTFG